MVKSSADLEIRGLTVLLVEDDHDAIDELREIVELEDWTPVTASNVNDALVEIEKNPQIGVVVTDVHFVDPSGDTSNGIQLVSRAQAKFPDRALSFVVLSGDPGAVKSSIQSGAVDFLTKPLVPDELVAAIKKARATGGEERTASELTNFLLKKVQQTASAGDGEAAVRSQARLQQTQDLKAKGASVIRHAVQEGLIRPWFQPQLSLQTGRISGFDAVARWDAPEGGPAEPADFRQTARSSGTLTMLNGAIRSDALRTMRHFQRSGISNCRMHVGMDVTEVTAETIKTAKALLEEIELPPEMLGLRFRASAATDPQAFARMAPLLEDFPHRSLRVELGDIGAGMAAISALNGFKIDCVMLDLGTDARLHEDAVSQGLVRALFALCKTLEIDVLVAGVESAAELAWLRFEGCAAVQGPHIAQPMPSEQALSWALGNAATDAHAEAS